MQLLVAAVGQRMPAWVQQGWAEYAGRFPRGLTLALREIPLARRGRNAAVDSLRETEAQALLAAVPAGHRIVALDERGDQWTTAELARRLQLWMREERGVCFLVGGPDGLTDDCRQRAQDVWGLSRLTLPHAMVRVVLAEQLYRAWTVTQNHPYHRE
ncbi:MAG: 23S rRNA (pseudouridine(1915)-N(3))-methyltransferase RlmH [Xanthomonadales bacterium]|nr:23S rRNA (pseudouridine(1915)-N(3))-methyltransferase RlmH [Xanthomonadales bacterium]